MKKFILFSLYILCMLNAHGQANDCFSANAFCSSSGYTFPNATTGSAPSGPNYGCLGQVPRPIWYYMEIGIAGTIRMSIQQTSGDVDFVMWGPFPSFTQGCQQIMSGTAPIQSSYSTSSSETIGIGMQGGSNSICSGSGPGQSTPPAAQVGQVYIVLITNYVGTSGTISFNQTGGTGGTNCSIVEPCAIDNFTVNVSACSAPTSTYAVSGTIGITNPPTTGQLILRDCNGNQFTIASAPFNSSSYPYNLSGLNASGTACSVEAFFSAQAATCSAILTYTAPSCTNPCSISNITANAACQSGGTYNVTGSLNFTNPPSTGQLIVQDCSGNSQTFSAPFTSPLNYSITNLTPNGQACSVTAHFTADPSCTISTNYTASELPLVDAGQDISICQGGSTNLTASGANSYSWNTGETTQTISVSPSTTTTYTVTGTTNGCSATDQVTVTVGNSLSVTMSPDEAICEGETTIISASGADSYLWSNGETNASFSVSPTTTTTYSVTGTDANNCTGTGQVTVTVNPIPDAVATGTTTVCQQDTQPIITFTGSNSSAGDYSFSYNLNNGTPQTITATGNNPATINVPTNASGTFIYELIGVTDPTTGCNQAINQIQTIIVNPMPAALIQGNANVCQGGIAQQVTFTGSNGTADYLFTYSFNGGTAQTLSTSGSETATIPVQTNTPGTFTYELQSVQDIATGCTQTQTGTVTVIVNPTPIISSNNVEVCQGGTVQIQATGADTYSWTPATYLNATAGQTVTFTSGLSTVYTITGTTTAGCTATTTVTATVNPNPVIEAGNNVSECQENQIILTATGAGIGGSYTWDNGAVNSLPFIPPIGVTTFTVVGITSNGCTGTDFLTVNVEPIPQLAFTAVQNQNCVPVEAVFQNTGDVGVSCSWIFDNGKTATGCGNVAQLFPYPGIYGATLRVESANGCIATLYQDSMIVVDANPIASFTPSSIIFNTTNTLVHFTNNSLGAVSYNWNFGDEAGTVSSEVNPSHTYPEEARGYIVTLIASSQAGCTDTAYYSIRANEDLIFYIPNAFTPDNDEFNQMFLPIFTSGFDPFDYNLVIFNRWGEKVFESNNASVGWKGNYGVDGKNCQQGTYIWKIEFKTNVNDERKTYTGHVNLMR